jgi:hypothetical protein
MNMVASCTYMFILRGNINMRKTLAIVLTAVMLFAIFTGCGRARGKLVENFAEDILENQLGEDVNLDLKEGGIEFENEEDKKISIGAGGDWPENDLARNMPEYESGEITSVMTHPDMVQIVIQDDDTDYFDKYLAKVKKTYTESLFDSKDADNVNFQATNGGNLTINIFYDYEEVVISLIKTEE